MRRFVWTIAFAAAQSAANAAPVLDTLVPCPAVSPCLYVDIFSDAHRQGTAITGPSGLQIFLAVQGRLNGGAPTLYTAKIFDASLGQLPLTAYLGRSAANNPLIQTDRGVLEIMGTEFDVAASNYHVIDTVQWKVVDNYLQLSYGDFLIFTAGEPTGVWSDERKLCLSAPVRRPGLLKVASKSCAARPKKLGERSVEGDVAPQAVQLGRLKQLLPTLVNDRMGPLTKVAASFDDDEVGVAVYGVKGARRAVVVPYYVHED